MRIYGPIDYVSLCVFDLIDKIMIFDAASKESPALRISKQRAGFERGDCRIHTTHLCWKAIPLADSSPCIKTLEFDLLALVRQIVGKAIAGISTKEIREAAGPLQFCAGHSAGSEVAIHAMFQGTDGQMNEQMNDRSINRSVALHPDNLQNNVILHH